ncbi:hypothetical protein FHS55_000321 [Angulomicrobium tetraedrale]|uniref:DoxX family protein n=1 Tax=Ancylobacter tetraedralis TaxID=217068 RepID=A0A839Z6W8_9HYPH|nr:hypothetical protein [Ancylobacter tetraedralis]MBB3769735.1 hypothetical protein [Ancylobacter tetraedralis]
MYYAIVLATMVVLPIASIAAELSTTTGIASFVLVSIKWFAFWAVGVRLLLAGLSQILRPAFTVKGILGIDEPRAHVLAQELGFANTAIGLAGLFSMMLAGWVAPIAFTGGIFLGLAGLNHLRRPGRNLRETVAMVTDLWAAFVLLLTFVLSLF